MKQNSDDIDSYLINDIGLTHLEQMTIETNPELPPVESKPSPLPLKYKFIKEEIKKLLEGRLIEKINESLCNKSVLYENSTPRMFTTILEKIILFVRVWIH